MVVYLIKSALCLLVLFTFYKLALEGEHMHRFKRFYLLGSLIFSLVLPLVEFTYYTNTIPTEESAAYEMMTTGVAASESISETGQFSDLIPYIFGIIYLVGLVFFGLRFFRNLRTIFKRVKMNKNITTPYYTSVLLQEKLNPHSFLKYIFLNKKAYQNGEIEQEVLEHEAAHVRQKHSIDILIIEALQAIFWFNPLLIIYKISMQMNHEFLADKAVVERQGPGIDYSKLLFNYSTGRHQGLASSFNHSLIKKRILMISKPFSKKRLATRLSLLLPVLAVCIFLFNSGITAKPLDNPPENLTMNKDLQDPGELMIKVDGEQIWINQEKVALKNLSGAIDRATKGMTEEELRELKLNFNVKLNEGEEGRSFLQKFNREFLKSRLSKVLGKDLFPPAPPEPPKPPHPDMNDVPAPPAPPAPMHPEAHDSLHRAHSDKREQIREEIRIEREMQMAEKEKAREIHMEIVRERRDSIQNKREEIIVERMEEKEAEMAEKQKEMIEKQEKLREKRDKLREKAEKKKEKAKETEENSY